MVSWGIGCYKNVSKGKFFQLKKERKKNDRYLFEGVLVSLNAHDLCSGVVGIVRVVHIVCLEDRGVLHIRLLVDSLREKSSG